MARRGGAADSGGDRHRGMTRASKADLKKTLSRKSERRQKRDGKKARRQENNARAAERKRALLERQQQFREDQRRRDANAAAAADKRGGRKRARDGEGDDAANTRSRSDRGDKVSKKRRQITPAEKKFKNPEDEEIEYLERKLGLKSSSDKRDKNWQRVVRELKMDGFDEDLLGFVGELDKGKTITDLERAEGEFTPAMARKMAAAAAAAQSDDDDDDVHVAVESEPLQSSRREGTNGVLDDLDAAFGSDQDQSYDDDDDDDDDEEEEEEEESHDGSEGEDDDDLSDVEDSEVEAERSDLDEDEEDDDSSVGDEDVEDEASSKGEVEDNDEDALADAKVSSDNVTYLPKSDLYGAASASEGQTEEGGGQRRRSKFFEKFGGEKMRLRRFLNGLVNRLTEDNMQPLATQIAGLYHEHPRSMVNETLCDVILSGLMNEVLVMTTLATNYAGLVSTLCSLQGAHVGAAVLESLVLKFEMVLAESASDEEEEDDEADEDDEVVASKKGANLAVFLSHLLSFGVSGPGLLFDLLERLTETPLDSAQVETFITVINECGHRLRKSDPARLVRVIERLQAHDERDDAARGGASHSRKDYLLEEIYALKNNRKRNEAVEERIKRTLRFVKQVRTSTDSRFVALQLPWDDLVHAEERGRWWIVGGVWKDQDEQLRRNKAAANGALGGAPGLASGGGAGGGGQGPVARALARAPASLVDLAKRQRMNTDIRRAIFCEIMSAEDAFDGLQRLSALNLKDRQEREIAHVVMRCCSASKKFNVYYGELAVRLCQQKPQFKFTFQIAFWDTFKELESMKTRQITNLAKLLAHMMLQSALSLSALKTVEFASLEDQGVLFFNVFFASFLCHGGQDRDAARRVAQTINRLGGSKDFQVVSDGMLLFFHRHLSVPDGPDSLLAKRLKMMKRVIDGLVLKRSMREEPGEDLFI